MPRQMDPLAAVRAELAAALAERRRLMRAWLPPDWIHERCLGGLTASESWLLALLLHRPAYNREQLHAAICLGADTDHQDLRKVDVLVCRVRRKLRPFRIEIHTFYKKGFGMTAEMRAKAERLLRDQSAQLDAEEERRCAQARPVRPASRAAVAGAGQVAP